MTLRVGEQVDHYLVESHLGAGAMASVWRVRDVHLQRLNALKTLHDHLLTNADVRQRFLAEGQLLAQLHHHNIAKVISIVVAEGVAGLLLELLDGATLERRLADGPLGASEMRAVFLPTLSALAYAHQNGVIHRDLKPANLFLDTTNQTLRPVILDFGIAKSSNRIAMTADGTRMGTAQYMSPEQRANPHQVDQRSDIFAMGAVLYEAVVGRPAFEGNPGDIEAAMEEERLNEPSPDEAPLWPILAPVIRTCLRPAAGLRFPTANALAEQLDAALTVAEEARTRHRQRRPPPPTETEPTFEAASEAPEPVVVAEPPTPYDTEPGPEGVYQYIMSYNAGYVVTWRNSPRDPALEQAAEDEISRWTLADRGGVVLAGLRDRPGMSLVVLGQLVTPESGARAYWERVVHVERSDSLVRRNLRAVIRGLERQPSEAINPNRWRTLAAADLGDPGPLAALVRLAWRQAIDRQHCRMDVEGSAALDALAFLRECLPEPVRRETALALGVQAVGGAAQRALVIAGCAPGSVPEVVPARQRHRDDPWLCWFDSRVSSLHYPARLGLRERPDVVARLPHGARAHADIPTEASVTAMLCAPAMLSNRRPPVDPPGDDAGRALLWALLLVDIPSGAEAQTAARGALMALQWHDQSELLGELWLEIELEEASQRGTWVANPRRAANLGPAAKIGYLRAALAALDQLAPRSRRSSWMAEPLDPERFPPGRWQNALAMLGRTARPPSGYDVVQYIAGRETPLPPTTILPACLRLRAVTRRDPSIQLDEQRFRELLAWLLDNSQSYEELAPAVALFA